MNGLLYGTTEAGGGRPHRIGSGTVFSITTGGKEQVLYYFDSYHQRGHQRRNGKDPSAALIDVSGMLYGTTTGGGKHGYGTVFRISTTGVEHVIHRFAGGSDGADTIGRLLNVNGALYGTTWLGGYGSYGGCGTVFSLTPSGSEHVLYSFKGDSDGCGPSGGLIDVNGALYGTTEYGGTYGYGTAFSISTSGSEQVLYNFGSGYDGRRPGGDLLDVNGTLYGTTEYGGTYGYGTAFSISTSGSEQVLYNFGSGYDGQNPRGT